MADFQPSDPDYLDRVRESFDKQGLMKTLGAELTAVHPGFCEIRMPYGEGLTQQHGFFHAGGLAAIVDTAGGYAGFTLFDKTDGILTVEFKVNLVAPATGEAVVARGEVIRPGRTLTVTKGEVVSVVNGEEKVCALMQQTLMRIVNRPEVVG